jgi:hypothetical protein
MNYSITPSEDQKYIIHKITGDIDRSIALPQVLESHALGRKLGIDRFLVDLREARNIDNIGNSFFFTNQDLKTNSRINIFARAALLISPEDESHNFIELTAINANLHFRLCTDHDQAMQYLFDE